MNCHCCIGIILHRLLTSPILMENISVCSSLLVYDTLAEQWQTGDTQIQDWPHSTQPLATLPRTLAESGGRGPCLSLYCYGIKL